MSEKQLTVIVAGTTGTGKTTVGGLIVGLLREAGFEVELGRRLEQDLEYVQPKLAECVEALASRVKVKVVEASNAATPVIASRLNPRVEVK